MLKNGVESNVDFLFILSHHHDHSKQRFLTSNSKKLINIQNKMYLLNIIQFTRVSYNISIQDDPEL